MLRTCRRLTAPLALAASLAMALATPTHAQSPKRGGTLVYAVTAEPPTYDCHATSTYAALHVLSPHYSLLLKLDPERFPEPVPDVAHSWSISPDGLSAMGPT